MRIVLALLFVAACGGDDDAGDDGGDVSFSTHTLDCPSDSLDLTTPGGFQPGTEVTFETSDGDEIDGSAVVLNDGSIDCGLPQSAAPGTYTVLVDGNDVGTVVLAHTNC